MSEQYAVDGCPADSDLSQTLQSASPGIDQKGSASGFNQRARPKSVQTGQWSTGPEERHLDLLSGQIGRTQRHGQSQDA
jgi:hypothetical protein